MKRIILCLVLVISVIGFSEEIQLERKYNKNSTWSICISSDSTAKKDCSVIFKGNPYKEFKVFKNEDGHNGMYIKYRDMIIVDSKEGDLQRIETKTKPMPKKTRPAEIDENLASAITVSVSSEDSELKGLLPPEALSHLKVYGKNVYYIRMAFINHTVSSEIKENE